MNALKSVRLLKNKKREHLLQNYNTFNDKYYNITYKLEIMEGWTVSENGVKSILIVLKFCYQCLNREHFLTFKKKKKKVISRDSWESNN